MSNNVLNPQEQYKDDAGNFLANGTLTFSDNGTNTANTSIFSDEALTTSIVTAAGVYTLDAAGRTKGDVIYKGRRRVTVKNSAGDTIRFFDDVVSSFSVDNTYEYELGSIAATQSHPGIITGTIIRFNYLDANRTISTGASVRYDGTSASGKAGNWPDADGFYYDAVQGKKFVSFVDGVQGDFVTSSFILGLFNL